ncbi:ribonucleoprotein PTB-binding 1-like isoform X2 [Mercenaria mercenaria]|uniref:ribonucleoprotein PTB-binding 1-like isoform X2 n=1 Tax=Mercenaria mercenaria TaxID=6596 RepID=UPI00234E5AAE|nr:ribonucleoprotein PTB-binding 1-like isoform X2 [Mercenaria mercenaria]
MSDTADNFSDNASNKELLEKAKNEFNREKRLAIKNLPSNTTEKDIRAFMGFNGEFPVESVQMVKNFNQAIVTLKDPSLVDDAISKLDNTKLHTLTVSVSVYRSEKILCIAQLPLSMTEYKFRELVLEHGNIDMCFLMRSEETGESKGYGFVEYNEPIEKVGQIKCALDWSVVDGHTVHCDAIVDSSQSGITFQDLHSKCLIIDNLPKDYNDSIALRQVFSEFVKPVYCQIVTKEGESLGFGILEYDDAEDAEGSFNEFNKHELNGVPMNISYCIPGKSAIHMFNRIMFKYGDKVHVNRASLLPDPVYPNPAFLKHVFFKTHVAKHPRLLVQFTDNLLHLQEGYVKQLEDRTNAKPGLLGPAPTIPMSPLMDINLQLGLLSVIVLDMRENGTYNGEVPEPLGKVKIPTDEEFQEKPQPVSLLGDPMTAQANIILKNLLMPQDKPEFHKPSADETTPKLLGKPVYEFNMVYLCSLGRLMAMLSEKTQSMGILGNAPSGPPKPLMEGLMQAGKVAQTLLHNMGMSQQNPQNKFTRNQREQNQQGLLGNPPNMNTNTAKAASNFMNTIQQLAIQKMSHSGNKQDLNSLFGNTGNMNNSSNSGDGLLGSYQGQGQGRLPSLLENQMPDQSQQGKQPQSLLSLNFNSKGDGLIPTPKMEDEAGFGFYVNQGGSYDDSGYQGGFDEADYSEAYGDPMSNIDDRNNGCYGNMMGQNFSARKLMEQDLDVTANSNRFDGAYFSGINARQKTGLGPGMNRMSDKRDGHYNNIAQQAAFYAAGAAAAYKQQYEDWVQSGYNGNYGNNGADYNADNGFNINGGQGNFGQDMSGSHGNQQTGLYGSEGGLGQMGNSSGMNSLLGSFNNSQQFGSSKNTQRNELAMKSGASSLASSFGRDGAVRSSFTGSSGRGGNMTPGGVTRSGVRSLMGPPSIPPLQSIPTWSSGIAQSSTATPQGQKRPFSHILPSPEPSPEGDYIGQHSQGLGGHYADTYTKRQKLTGRF